MANLISQQQLTTYVPSVDLGQFPSECDVKTIHDVAWQRYEAPDSLNARHKQHSSLVEDISHKFINKQYFSFPSDSE